MIAVTVVVVEMLVWAAAVIDAVVLVELLWLGVVIDTLDGVEIIVATAVVIAWAFVVSISYFAGVLSNVVVGALIDALAEAMTGFVSGVEVLANANVNVFASVMAALEFVVSKPT